MLINSSVSKTEHPNVSLWCLVCVLSVHFLKYDTVSELGYLLACWFSNMLYHKLHECSKISSVKIYSRSFVVNILTRMKRHTSSLPVCDRLCQLKKEMHVMILMGLFTSTVVTIFQVRYAFLHYMQYGVYICVLYPLSYIYLPCRSGAMQVGSFLHCITASKVTQHLLCIWWAFSHVSFHFLFFYMVYAGTMLTSVDYIVNNNT